MPRRPIAELAEHDDLDAVIIVGDGNVADTAIDLCFGGWVDLSDRANPRELELTPTWFELVWRVS